jgi:KTSC domain
VSLLLRNMVPVNSSCIAAAGYSAADQRLAIRFKSGRLKFYSTPVRIFQELMEATSAGRYFNQRIKGKYGNHHTSQCGNRLRSDFLQNQEAETQKEVEGLGSDSKLCPQSAASFDSPSVPAPLSKLMGSLRRTG